MLARYDLYFRRRPWLPTIEHLGRSHQALENWLPEPAQDTITGLRGLLNDLVEELASWALRVWDQQAQKPFLVAPSQPGPCKVGRASVSPALTPRRRRRRLTRFGSVRPMRNTSAWQSSCVCAWLK
jgi:hypothetical protein